ncbi:hypothetical protein [Methylobacterium durans]|uniref:Uncharacterized protein n=1 Tax=Methylobacterium durans TaxID=2202825 RepID=A0A2U8WD22_9HYPH|nr:hypothetical protein [Methylobacterium durans]AWN43340.1 hypothetical protein DK389_26070 [Methylobacterium durans]
MQDEIERLNGEIAGLCEHEPDRRVALHNRLWLRINDADRAIAELGFWLAIVTVLCLVEAVAIGLLCCFR